MTTHSLPATNNDISPGHDLKLLPSTQGGGYDVIEFVFCHRCSGPHCGEPCAFLIFRPLRGEPCILVV